MNFKERLIKADPVLGEMLNNQKLLAQTIVDGAVAGDVAVTEIKSGDELSAVINLTDSTDVTSEFSITKDGIINNTGGTATTGDKLLVTYLMWEER